ncbi:MAG TPA: FAD-dependent oxidoreductase [Pseudonocardiaceae bacterium]
MRIVVVGAGYAGTTAANRLARKLGSAEITVVNPRPQFVERVRLHQQLAGTGSADTPLTAMLREGITARVGTVDKIGDGTLALDDGDRIDFDHAVLAVGSTVQPLPGTVPVGTWEGAEQARAAVAALPAGGTVTVVGTGATGIETAAEVAGARPDLRVRLAGPPPAATFTPGAQRRIRAGLERLGVHLVEGLVTEVSGGDVRLRSGRAFASDLTLWGIVSGVPDLAARSGLAVDATGRALVDRYLRSVSDDRILVAGDCAGVPGARPCCVNALPQAAHAAGTLARLVTGRPPRPYSLLHLGACVKLGRTDAVLQLTDRSGPARRPYLAGPAAARIGEFGARSAKLNARIGAIARG